MGVFFVNKFYFTEIQVSPCFRLKTWKYNICDIKLVMKVMCLHKIHVEWISSFLLNMYVVHDL